MKRPAILFFSMSEAGHFQRLRPLIADVTARGFPAWVFTHRDFRNDVERAGGIFVDLFSRYSLEAADDESLPVPCRFVSFAGRYAEAIRADVEALGARLVVHDTFAVVGRVVARLLGLPHVNVCAGHNVAPDRFVAQLEHDPRVRIAPRCWDAVASLRNRYGIEDASPFSYVSSLSSFLNLYCEPPEFLDEPDRGVFEPLAFYGSLPALEDDRSRSRAAAAEAQRGNGGPARVYVSFGTVVWRYYAAEALAALTVLARWAERTPRVRARIGLGGVALERAQRRILERPNVIVEDYVDQWDVLSRCDAFVTHHGLNSTHEAIFHGVPMISYPFFWDQPKLAERCRRLGVAVPLTDTLRGEVTDGAIDEAWRRLETGRESMRARLAGAREWELAVMAERPKVLQRVIDLCG